MSVYVDRFQATRKGRVTFVAHMVADSREELDAMAMRIGMKTAWRQKTGTSLEHYDLAESRREMAVRYGAIEVGWREMAALMQRKRKAA